MRAPQHSQIVSHRWLSDRALDRFAHGVTTRNLAARLADVVRAVAGVKGIPLTYVQRHPPRVTPASEAVMSARRENSEPSVRKGATPQPAARGQSDLFEPAPAHAEQTTSSGARSAAPSATDTSLTRTVLVSDLPRYDDDEMEIVDVSLAETSEAKIWFTYADIRRCFGVSRATVARKLKSGLVPGIRFQGNRVVEEGAVRRFSRTQVRYVLLAVRRRDWRSSVN